MARDVALPIPPASTSEPLVAEGCRTFYARLLRIEQGVEEILTLAEKWPGEPTVDLACAFLWLFGQTPDAQRNAEGFLVRAESGLGRLSDREAAWVRALRLWHSRRFDAAARAFEELTARWPEDLPAAKAAEFLYYILGQQESGPRFLAHMERLADRHRGDPDFLAMQAFAHELCGQGGPARACAEEALAITPRVPWAQHALEHVLLWEGSPDDAVATMESWLSGWEGVGRVIHCHNAWHVALMFVDRLSVDRAWAVFDAHVWNKAPGMVVEQLDSISFLWRAEMAGVPVDRARYRALVPHIAPLTDTLFMPFVTAHYAYALARAEETDVLDRLLDAVDRRAAGSDDEARRVWAPVGRSVIRGSAALGRDRTAEAAEWFDPVMGRMMCIGGSDAQDDLFRFAHFDSLRRSGRSSEARQWLGRRLDHKPASPLEEKLLVEV